MEKMNFDEAMFIKNIKSDLNNIHGINDIKFNNRRIRTLVYVHNGLREFVTCMKFAYSSCAKDLSEIIEKFRNFYNIPETESVKSIFIKIIDKINDYCIEMGWNPDGNNPNTYCKNNVFDNIIECTKSIIRQCDQINEFTQLAYRVDSTEETKYNKTTANQIVQYDAKVINSFGTSDSEELDKVMNDPNLKTNSQDYGRIVCKRCKMLKNEIISITNKYFGKNSKFSEFDIMNNII